MILIKVLVLPEAYRYFSNSAGHVSWIGRAALGDTAAWTHFLSGLTQEQCTLGRSIVLTACLADVVFTTGFWFMAAGCGMLWFRWRRSVGRLAFGFASFLGCLGLLYLLGLWLSFSTGQGPWLMIQWLPAITHLWIGIGWGVALVWGVLMTRQWLPRLIPVNTH